MVYLHWARVFQLDRLVAAARDDLTVVGRERHAQHVLGVIFKAAGRFASRQVPQTEGLVPRAGQSEVAIRREDNIRDEVRVTIEAFLGHAIVALLTSQLPHNQGLVAGGRQDHVGKLGVRGDLRDPAIVADKVAAELQGFAVHFCRWTAMADVDG